MIGRNLYASIVVLLIATVTLYSCQQCSYDTNIDYFGNDLIAEPVYTNSSDGCCLYCAQNSQCQVWTWVPATKACWLKTNVGSKRYKSIGRASGVRQYVSGMNYGSSGNYGNGYGNNYGSGYGNNNYGNGYGSNYGSGYGNNYGSGYGSGYNMYNMYYTTTASTTAATTTAAATASTAAATTVTATTTTTASTASTASVTPITTTTLVTAAATIPVTTFATAASATVSVCFIENNANYPGNDLSNQGNVASPGACCTLCGQTAGCVAFSYFAQFNWCFLKSAAPSAPGQAYPGIVSGKIVNSPTNTLG